GIRSARLWMTLSTWAQAALMASFCATISLRRETKAPPKAMAVISKSAPITPRINKPIFIGFFSPSIMLLATDPPAESALQFLHNNAETKVLLLQPSWLAPPPWLSKGEETRSHPHATSCRTPG